MNHEINIERLHGGMHELIKKSLNELEILTSDTLPQPNSFEKGKKDYLNKRSICIGNIPMSAYYLEAGETCRKFYEKYGAKTS